ncbi:Uncharacterised protein [Vibrio cholerae]|nr:Uncharacterised protein [Vibrio cholerae]
MKMACPTVESDFDRCCHQVVPYTHLSVKR